MKFQDTVYTIINCATKAHQKLGNSHQLDIYQQELATEMINEGLDIKSEIHTDTSLKSEYTEIPKTDFFVEEEIMVEIISISELEDTHVAQATRHCKEYNLPTGLIINFGAEELEYQRVYYIDHPGNNFFNGVS